MNLPRSSYFQRTLDRIERVGNALPHPATLFLILCAIVIGLSWIISMLGLQVPHPTTGVPLRSFNLLSVEGLHKIILGLLPNFINFAPLGAVLVCLLGLSIAEHSGLLGAVLRLVVQATPQRLLTMVVVFAGATSNTAGDVGYVLLLPLSAALFLAAGRHPLAGIAAAFSGISGGFAANLLLSPTDLILAGFTQEAARLILPDYTVTAVANYYFLASSVFVVTVVGTLVTEWVVMPRLGKYTGSVPVGQVESLGPSEWRGLRWAMSATLVLSGLILAGLVPKNGFLLDPLRPGFVGSYFLRGLVFFVFIGGLIPGIAYGVGAGTIRRDRDVYQGMQKTLELVAGYMVVIFFIAQFVNFFKWTNLGVMLAVEGAVFLRWLDLGAVPLLIGLVLLTATVNLVLGSSSAKWALLAPIFVPMFMLLGYSPELTQVSYRVGDSITNIVTPLMSNFPLVLMFVQRYEPRAGIGTITATMLPYSLGNLICWTLWLIAWVLLGWPLGPGAQLMLGGH